MAPIYDREKNKKVDLISSNYSEIYTLCVTVDNFNEFAAKAEKLSFIQLKSDTIVLSIDDFRVYTDVFNNPLYFLHYFKQRKKAVQTPQVALNDELDHLGLYLNFNIYTMKAEELNSNTHLSAFGLREDIDNYFASLHNERLSFEKPSQSIPEKIEEIIDFINHKKTSGRLILSTFLLNFHFQRRQEFSDAIGYSLVRQKEIKRMIRMIVSGEKRYCLFVYQHEVEKMNEQEKDDYTYASMMIHNEPDRLCINLHYGNNKELVQVDFKTYISSEIPEVKHEKLKSLGGYIIRSRAETYKKQTNKKEIGRNDTCPCGSGKKYKK